MKFTLCKVRPANYAHADAFDEVMEGLQASLQALGHTVARTNNQFDEFTHNIVFGAFLLDPAQVARLPKGTIVFNSEQIHHAAYRPASPALQWCQAGFGVWDYSLRNIAHLRALGVEAAHYPIGYHASLQRIPRHGPHDIDVLFYGSLSERRARVLNAMLARGLKVRHLYGVYGAGRDACMARSRIVLNLCNHAGGDFEVFRCAYAMNNAKAVLSEAQPDEPIALPYRDGLLACTYDELADAAVQLREDAHQRAELEDRALSALQRIDQITAVERILDVQFGH